MRFLGCPVFGFWLPFFGWRDMPADEKGFPCLTCPESGHSLSRPRAIGSFLHFEWLGHGIVFSGSNYRPLV